MKKLTLIAMFVAISPIFFTSLAHAQYFKPSIDGSWLHSSSYTSIVAENGIFCSCHIKPKMCKSKKYLDSNK